MWTGGEGNTPILPCAEVLLQMVLFATSLIRIPEVAEQDLKGAEMMLVLAQFPHSCENSEAVAQEQPLQSCHS